MLWKVIPRMMGTVMMVCPMQEVAVPMQTGTVWEDIPARPDTWKMMVIPREDAKKGKRYERIFD